MARTVSIGNQDFESLRLKNSFYVDKTGFIREWWESEDVVTLITRPRRFGKTLTLNMLEKFFSVEYAGRADLFDGLAIWKEEKYRSLQGTYPVLMVSFADVKENTFAQTRKAMCRILRFLYDKFSFLLEGDLLSESEKKDFRKISAEMEDNEASFSLKMLSLYLSRYYGKKVIILLDEYDTPMQEAFVNGYWEELTDFMRGFLNASFKTNPYLGRGIMTGITRVGKESIFSDLNNLSVITAASRLYETAFGFTEYEVQEALQEYGLQDESDKVKLWYDGFRFGNCDNIYNPWSITNFLKFREFGAYWANTSSNQLVSNLIQQGSPNIKMIMEDLLQGKHFCTSMDEQIIFDQLNHSESAVWSLLLAGGYLKIVKTGVWNRESCESGIEDISYELALTNQEIVFLFKKLIRGWFDPTDAAYNGFIKAMLADNVKEMNAYMNKAVPLLLGCFDTGNRPSAKTEPERLHSVKATTKGLKEPNPSVCFYHGLVLGIIVDLAKKYIITSNRESGLGRYDVMLEPRSLADDGIIFEFKVFDGDGENGLMDTVHAAIRQILNKKYAAVLEDKIVDKSRIRIYGFAFRGKEVLIDGGYLAKYESAQYHALLEGYDYS